MSNTKHTPGPWQVISGVVFTADPRLNDEEQACIALMDRETTDTTPTERDANACLTAVAPELQEVLEAAPAFPIDITPENVAEFKHRYESWAVLRERAIAKAEGR